MEGNSPYSDEVINNYSGLKSQERYLMNSNSNSAFSTSPSSRNSFEIVGGNQRQTISAQVKVTKKTMRSDRMNFYREISSLTQTRQALAKILIKVTDNIQIEVLVNSDNHSFQLNYLKTIVFFQGIMIQSSSRDENAALHYYGSTSGFQGGM